MSMKRIKLGYYYYYVVIFDDFLMRKFRGKNIVFEGVVEDKFFVEFFLMEFFSWRIMFKIYGFFVEFVGSLCVGKGDIVKVYGCFVGDGIIVIVIEIERVIFIMEE